MTQQAQPRAGVAAVCRCERCDEAGAFAVAIDTGAAAGAAVGGHAAARHVAHVSCAIHVTLTPSACPRAEVEFV